MNQEKNSSEKEIKRGAAMELIARITLEDGSVEEHVVKVDGGVPGLSDADFSSIDAVKRTIAAYEKPAIAAGNKLLGEVANGHMERLSKKKSSRKE
ncbi:MAG: hypothetical protein IKQ59_02550 [Prevotella sp.]|jgi:hypothetical protein|nr:hypothetical protein [Prevotella sp.]